MTPNPKTWQPAREWAKTHKRPMSKQVCARLCRTKRLGKACREAIDPVSGQVRYWVRIGTPDPRMPTGVHAGKTGEIGQKTAKKKK